MSHVTHSNGGGNQEDGVRYHVHVAHFRYDSLWTFSIWIMNHVTHVNGGYQKNRVANHVNAAHFRYDSL